MEYEIVTYEFICVNGLSLDYVDSIKTLNIHFQINVSYEKRKQQDFFEHLMRSYMLVLNGVFAHFFYYAFQ